MAPLSNSKDVDSGDAPLLSIVIPTYNRAAKLSATVAAILPQLTPECELLIVDNASTPSAEEALAEVTNLAGDHPCRIIRNTCNVGVSANVLRCFEYAKGVWVWVLSDDDLPLPDAVDTALRNAREFNDAVFINFWSNVPTHFRDDDGALPPRRDPMVLNGLGELIASHESFSHLLFISSSIYRRDILPDAISKAYIYSGTFAPHLNLLFIYLRRNGGKSVLSPDILVDWGRHDSGDKGWDVHSVSLRLPEMANIFPLQETRKKFGLLISSNLEPAYPIRGFILLALLGDKEHYARQIDDELLSIRNRCLLRGRIKIGSWFRLGLIIIISKFYHLLEWAGRISGYRSKHPGIPDRDMVTRMLDDHRI